MPKANHCAIFLAAILTMINPAFAQIPDIITQMNEEYTSDYCLALEMAYGEGMMSEGGSQAVDAMFEGIELQGKSMLDIGSGLGGAAQYLAKQYQAKVTGVEVNPWMVDYAQAARETGLESHLDFQLIEDGKTLPFDDESFDVVYSKGVFTHVEDKGPIFQEIFRVLKPNGRLVITDWLSPNQAKWGPLISQLTELEGLKLFAQNETTYETTLRRVGFVDVRVKDVNPEYLQYNLDIIKRLSVQPDRFVERFDLKTLQDHIEGYELIADAIATNELLVRHFVAKKV